MADDAPRPLVDASTRAVDAPDRFDYFCDLLGDVYRGITPQRRGAGDFVAEITAFPLQDGGVAARMRAPAHAAARRPRGDDDDALFINVVADAPARLDHLGERTVLRPGQPVIIDNSRPFELVLGTSRAMRLYSLRIPRAGIDSPLRREDIAAANRRLASGRGDGLALQAQLMQRAFDDADIAAADAMTRAMTALVATALRGERATAPGPAARGSFPVLTALARDHLDDAGFGLNELSSAARVSPRSVQNAFAAAGTTWSAWALGTRLDAARDRIRSSRWADRSLESIALASGFRDVSHFHRSFRARFGHSPGALRPRD